MANTFVIEQPQSIPVTLSSQEWSTDLFDCFKDIPTCCFAYWCLPCFACRTSKEFGEHECLPLLDIFGGSAITMSMRLSVRQRYGINGSIARDCVYVTFCTSCVWCQMSREIKRRRIQIVMVDAKNI
ncbi:PREDICTED: cornifelin homolog B-like isoform X2 [Cyprinodon variegatus]|uniref:cornifelin homolog B-like isoform X2 n=1 Tax=Cyprinodon variegatus TaxID=28743 RepID=UPI000742C1C8|nr:PREDICTED: cornifelin homolog B-like isoform X2 [Cyprinodon variegatus]